MIAKELASYLQARGIGTVGVDIFIGDFVSSKEAGVYLVHNGGGGQDAYLDTYYENLDIWSADPQKLDSYNKLKSVRDILSRNTNYDLTNYYVYYSQDVSNIMDMDRTIDGLALHKMTLRIIYRDKNLIS
jgi:hypothetical protein